MALRALLLIILAVIVIAVGDHEVQKEDNVKKTLATEKEKPHPVNLDREQSSLKKLYNMRNRSDDRKQNRKKGKLNIIKLHQLNQNMSNDNMMNDNEGAVTTNLKVSDNNTLHDKMNSLRQDTAKLPGTIYEAKNANDFVSQAAGVFCNFENVTSVMQSHMCMWQWNMTVSSHGLGFKVVTAADIARLNETTRGLRFTGPGTDADGNVGGEIDEVFPLVSHDWCDSI